MKFSITSIIAFVAIAFANLTHADQSCGIELNKGNTQSIAHEIAGHALDPDNKHVGDFANPDAKKPGKKTLPWKLSKQTDLGQFISDIMLELPVASRDGNTPLKVKKRELSNGRTAWVEINTGTFVVYEPTNVDCGSAYRRDHAEDYWKNRK